MYGVLACSRLRSTGIGTIKLPGGGTSTGLLNVTGSAYESLSVGEFVHEDGRQAVMICNNEVGRVGS
jgi:hypothetical protein